MTPSKLDAAAALESMDSDDRAAVQDCTPSFDFSALGELSGQAAEADRQFDLHYGTAQDEYLISCIYLAKVHALTAKAGRYGGGTWTKWYESKGLSKSGVWNMVKTGESFNGSTVEQLKQLPELTRKDLNLIARSGCADQLVDTAGDSQRVQELLAKLKAEQDRADTAEGSLTAALADVQGLTEQNARLQQSYNTAQDDRIAANLQRQKAEAERDKAEARAKDAEEALKHQPIAGVVDKEEVRRQANEMSRQAKEQADRKVQEAQRATAALQADFERFRQAADGFLAPEQVCAQQAQMIANAMRSMYLNWCGQAVAAGAPLAQMGAPLYALCGEIQSSLEEDTTINPTAAGSVEDAEREALFE